jgi:enoyl-CoA hydratase/carnithine racemase
VSSEGVVETSLQGRVGIIRLVNERGRNAMTQAWRDGMAASVAEMITDPDVRAIYLTGPRQGLLRRR